MSSASIKQQHVFGGNPIKWNTAPKSDPLSSFQTLKKALQDLESGGGNTNNNDLKLKVLPLRKGRPLVSSTHQHHLWDLTWLPLSQFNHYLQQQQEEEYHYSSDSFVYLGSDGDVVYWAIDVSDATSLVTLFRATQLCFIDLRTLMVATDPSNQPTLAQLSIAGYARALLEWHNTSLFCGHCGEKNVPIEAGRRKQCSNESCKKKIYPRVDPVVIMLVIDKENDRALLSKQSRFVPRMWSCLAGFIEPGESLEEAVRRETWEETGIEVGEVIYHSSQPWPVGGSSMPCQLMVGFLAYATSLEINVDKEELEDAKWYSREEVKGALSLAEYGKAQGTAAVKVEQMCKGVEKGQSLSADFNVESGELAPMFVPAPFAIAHHLISHWLSQPPHPSSSSNL